MMSDSKITLEKNTSSYSSFLLISYLKQKNLYSERIFKGIEEYSNILINPQEWVDLSVFIKVMDNIALEFKDNPEFFYNAGKEIMSNQVSFFQLLFFKLAPLSLICKKMGSFFEKNISKAIKTEAKLTKKGQFDVFFEPVNQFQYSSHLCDFNRGCTYAAFKNKNFKNATFNEVSCAARSDASRCHYRMTWTPQPSIIEKVKNIFTFSVSDQQSIIRHMEENHNALQEKYNEIKTLYGQLEKSEVKFRSIFENIQDVYFESFLDGTLLEVSPSVKQLSLYTRDELIGRDSPSLYADPENQAELLKTLHEKQSVNDYEVVLLNKDGSRLSCSINARLLFDEHRNPSKIVGIIRDISERKQAEFKRKQLEAQLNQAEKLKAVGQLAGGIAHDFKNQLFGISTGAKVIKKGYKADLYIQKRMDNIITITQRSNDLVMNLLSFAREREQQTVPVNLHTVITDSVELLIHTLDKKISIQTRLQSRDPFTAGDPSLLQNVLLNLAFNARDAMPDGGELVFSTYDRDLTEEYCNALALTCHPGTCVVTTVRDTGTGMDAETIKHIFEPFYTTKKPGKGSGLGLSMVYGTIQSHNGAITVSSEQSIGTTMTLFLPYSKNTETKEPSRPTSSTISHFHDTISHILLIDDEGIVCSSVKELLADRPLTLSVFQNGNDGIDFYKKHWEEIDIVLLDIIMPKISGDEVFCKLKQINKDAKIIIFSGYSEKGIVTKLLEDGAVGYIEKPAANEDLFEEILRIFSEKRDIDYKKQISES